MDKVLKFFLTSVVNWKTTTLGVIAEINYLGEFLTLTGIALNALLDGDPTTTPDFRSIKTSFSMVMLGFAAIVGKDGDKSTEDVKRVQG